MTKRRGWAAFLLSWLLPGLGHLYCGLPVRAMGAYTLVMASSLLCLALVLASSATGALVAFTVTFLLVFLAVPADARRQARRASPEYELKPYNRWYVYAAIALLWVFGFQPALEGLVKSRLEAFRLPSSSMAPSLLAGDFILATKVPQLRHDAGSNDVVVFESRDTPGVMMISRIVGVSGDTISMADGVLHRNGMRLTECWAELEADSGVSAPEFAWQLRFRVPADSAPPTSRDWGPVVVPRDSVFILGDNRDRSYDSRYWGFLGRDRLRARPRMLYFSLDDTGDGYRFRAGRFGTTPWIAGQTGSCS